LIFHFEQREDEKKERKKREKRKEERRRKYQTSVRWKIKSEQEKEK